MGIWFSSTPSPESASKSSLGELPECCVAVMMGYMDPPQICKLALMNRTFRGASMADFVWESKLPPNYHLLLRQIFDDFPSDLGMRGIYARLCRVNTFDEGTKKVWLDRSMGKLCMSISAKGLSITGIDDRRYWNHIPTEESRFSSVAYLQQIWWFEVDGEVEFPFPPGTYSLFFRLHLGRASKRFVKIEAAKMRPSGPVRRQPKDSFIPPPPTPSYRPRDSDASSRPSSVGIGARPTLDLYKERSFQQSAVSTINSFLASHNFPITFKPASSPSSKDIHETLKFLLSLLLDSPFKLEDDLPFLLKRLNYPFKLNKSILKSPAAPHQWPTFLALLHWLVQICKSLHHNLSISSPSPLHNNLLLTYTLNSYLHFIRGDDDAVDNLDQQIREKILHEKALAQEKLKSTMDAAAALEAELERLRNAPSQRELLEKEKAMLEDDVKKFHKIIEEFSLKIEAMEKVLAEKEKQLEAKVGENAMICEENGELKRRVEMQTFNVRDVERMRKELQAVERDIGEAELARNTWEEKCWETDAELGHKVKDLEALAMDGNQGLRRLKIGNGVQYQLNPKGTTPAEIMGIDYKVTLKPALNSFADEIKKNSMGKLEESISLRQKSNENAARLEGKRNQLAAMQSYIDEMEAQMNIMKKETQDYTGRCSAEAQKMLEDVQLADHDLDNMEREVAEVLKASELKLQEATKQSEEEIQVHARKLFKLVDSVSQYKEHVGTKVSEMKRDLSETANAVSETYQGSFSAEFGRVFNATRQLE